MTTPYVPPRFYRSAAGLLMHLPELNLSLNVPADIFTVMRDAPDDELVAVIAARIRDALGSDPVSRRTVTRWAADAARYVRDHPLPRAGAYTEHATLTAQVEAEPAPYRLTLDAARLTEMERSVTLQLMDGGEDALAVWVAHIERHAPLLGLKLPVGAAATLVVAVRDELRAHWNAPGLKSWLTR
ncbi:hypothetical protein [Deinococcus kurensis]|uniref:hypothetical protein n=1 Tax=Deinococcus kurensis TaxID=2662757 RepID=UPI0012D2E459|nr:hypothetical protein [Deinococcus kurensis]